MHRSGISAVDAALWDLQGKALGVPVWQRLGGPTRDTVPVYCHCSAGDSPQTFAENLKRCRSWGYRAAKTTLPLFYGQDAPTAEGLGYSGHGGRIPQSLRETEWLPTETFSRVAEFFAAGREAVGTEFEIAVDCHGRLSPAAAIRLCDALEPYKLLFIEEPVPPEDPQALREVAARSSTPIAAGERLATVYGVRPYLESRSLAVHLLAAIPNCYMLEMIGSPADLELQARMVAAPLRPKDGQIALPDGPGLGMELLADAEKVLPYQPFAATRDRLPRQAT